MTNISDLSKRLQTFSKQELIEELIGALMKVTELATARPAQEPSQIKCEFCDKWHDPRVACPDYVAYRKVHGMCVTISGRDISDRGEDR